MGNGASKLGLEIADNTPKPVSDGIITVGGTLSSIDQRFLNLLKGSEDLAEDSLKILDFLIKYFPYILIGGGAIFILVELKNLL